VKFGKYVILQLKIAFASSFAVGLALGILLLVIGKVEGTITLDINLSPSDSVWFFLGVPLSVTLLFLVFCPISFFVHAAISRAWKETSSHDA